MTIPAPAVPAAPSRAGRVWAQTWRVLLAVVTGALGALVVYGTAAVETMGPDGTFTEAAALETLPAAGAWFLLVDVGGLLLSIPLYLLRHRAPLLVTGALVVVGSVSMLSSVLATFAVVSLATRRRWLEIGGISAMWLGAMLIGGRAFEQWVMPGDAGSGDPLVDLVLSLVFCALAVVTGMFIWGRRALLASLREQAAIARREADARGDSARAAERNRIAREMHDVLAHRLSLVALHAGALEYRAGLDPEQVRETAAVVRENAHEALGELREVLGLLRDPAATDEQSRPQPPFAQVGDLLEGTRAAGSPVTYVLDRVGEDDLARLPVSTSRHLYRVVQETLTNARKHAPGAPVHVRLHGAPGERVGIEVTNPVPPQPPAAPLPSSGWGLTGLSERLRLTGGGLDVQQHAGGVFTVNAWLPWAAGTEGTT